MGLLYKSAAWTKAVSTGQRFLCGADLHASVTPTSFDLFEFELQHGGWHTQQPVYHRWLSSLGTCIYTGNMWNAYMQIRLFDAAQCRAHDRPPAGARGCSLYASMLIIYSILINHNMFVHAWHRLTISIHASYCVMIPCAYDTWPTLNLGGGMPCAVRLDINLIARSRPAKHCRHPIAACMNICNNCTRDALISASVRSQHRMVHVLCKCRSYSQLML